MTHFPVNSNTHGSALRIPDHVALVLSEASASIAENDNKHLGDNLFKPLFEFARERGIRRLSLCSTSFSPSDEETASATGLSLLFQGLTQDTDWLRDRKVAVQSVNGHGNIELVADDKAQLNISIYSQIDGRADILAATKSILQKVEQGQISGKSITKELIGNQIAFQTIPDPDLLIFTGGLRCMHNGLLWQSAYTEFAFLEQGWRDLNLEHIEQAVEDYGRRERRFGGLKQEEAHPTEARQKFKNLMGIRRHP